MVRADRFETVAPAMALLALVLSAASATPRLHDAVAKEDLGLMSQSLASGADLNEKDTATARARRSQKRATAGGGDARAALIGQGQTPLMLAVLHGYTTAVRFLLSEGADMTIGEKGGYTPIHGAGARAPRLYHSHTQGGGLADTPRFTQLSEGEPRLRRFFPITGPT